MLVGDVRWAAPRGGSSCTLSGGRKLSPAVIWVSKNRQVRRAIMRRKLRSMSVSAGPRTTIGSLDHHDHTGATDHSASIGAAATSSASGRYTTATTASAGPTHMVASE